MDAARKKRLEDGGINVEAALNRFMGNEKMLEKYLGRFLNEKSYAALAAAVAAGDQAGAAVAVHTLKSVCGSIGCEHMQQMAISQEASMRAGNWDEVVEKMKEIELEYGKICQALSA